MEKLAIISRLKEKYPALIYDEFELPDAYIGTDEIKAIALGADPTHIVNSLPKPIKKVFELDNIKSPYWRSIGSNIDLIDGISLDNLHVENLCRNYFRKETSDNAHWVEIARDYWTPYFKKELDSLYRSEIPVLITTEFILQALLIDKNTKYKASNIYNDCIVIHPDANILNRKLIALYRHFKYSLSNWPEYCKFISKQL